MQADRYDVLIIGGGIAGITTALDLLDGGKVVALLDRDEESAFGGLARESFGGMLRRHRREQLRRIAAMRNHRGDRMRVCKFPPINEPKGIAADRGSWIHH